MAGIFQLLLNDLENRRGVECERSGRCTGFVPDGTNKDLENMGAHGSGGDE